MVDLLPYGILPYLVTAIAVVTRKDLAIIAALVMWMGELVWHSRLDYHSTIVGFSILNCALCVTAASHYYQHRDNLSITVGQVGLAALVCNFLQAISFTESGLQYLTGHVTGLLGWLLVLVLVQQDGRRELIHDLFSDAVHTIRRLNALYRGLRSRGGHE